MGPGQHLHSTLVHACHGKDRTTLQLASIMQELGLVENVLNFRWNWIRAHCSNRTAKGTVSKCVIFELWSICWMTSCLYTAVYDAGSVAGDPAI